jgi:predicted CxxxxCH...CXXCH cytochrome family protein
MGIPMKNRFPLDSEFEQRKVLPRKAAVASTKRASDWRAPFANTFVALMVLPGCARAPLDDGLSERQDCSACHGTAGNSAPPRALNGASKTSDIGVGAHAAHLTSGNVGAKVACSECHPLPTDYLTHPALEPRAAIVQFGTLATTSGATPSWDRNTRACNFTYCHGATLFGAETRIAPQWTVVDSTFLRCTSCHGFPPKGSHPLGTACQSCHGEVVGPGATIINSARHVDGIIDVTSPTTMSNSSNRGGIKGSLVPAWRRHEMTLARRGG